MRNTILNRFGLSLVELRAVPRVLGPLAALLILGACASTHPTGDGQWSHYGAKYRDHGRTVSLGEVSGGERDVVLKGTIHEVCLKMGCWIVLEDESGARIFVRTRNHVWFVPRNAAGHAVVARGDMVRRNVSVALLQHFAEDAGRTPEEIAAITEPETRLEMIADAIWIEGDGLDAPVRQ